jgi:hypothetical protein
MSETLYNRPMLDVADRKQLFIDHRFINTADNVELTVNPPVKLPGPVLRSEHPWEAFSIGWSCVLEDDGLFKLWYSACGADQWTGGPWYLCYAISRDGLTWEKPELGLVEYDGSKRNNIVRAACKLAYIFIDPNGGESDRYKMVEQVLGEGIRVGTSADGLTWDMPDRLVSTLKPDTPKQAYWDARIGRYVAWLKLMVADDGTPMFPFVDPIASDPPVIAPTVLRRGRSIGRIEVDDLTAPWPEENVRTVLAADEHDPPDSDIYHPDVLPYTEAEDAYFMFPMTYQHFGEGETTVRNDGLNDSQFAASRDGIHWMRYDRRPYLPRGVAGDPDCGQTHTSEFHFRDGNHLYQYYGAGPWTHGGFRRLDLEQRSDRANWGRSFYNVARQRLDGFVSADADYTGGWLTTPPIVFSGRELTLNVDVAAMGEARVEIQGADGRPLPGFSAGECDRVMVNDVAHTVSWNGNRDVHGLAGRPVRLKVAMRAAKLFAFQFR